MEFDFTFTTPGLCVESYVPMWDERTSTIDSAIDHAAAIAGRNGADFDGEDVVLIQLRGLPGMFRLCATDIKTTPIKTIRHHFKTWVAKQIELWA